MCVQQAMEWEKIRRRKRMLLYSVSPQPIASQSYIHVTVLDYLNVTGLVKRRKDLKYTNKFISISQE